MTIDEAIQKFAIYARGEGDFDELDLKEVIYARVAEKIDETVDKIVSDVNLSKLEHIMGQCKCEPFMDCWFWETKQKLVDEGFEDNCHAIEFHRRQFRAIKDEQILITATQSQLT